MTSPACSDYTMREGEQMQKENGNWTTLLQSWKAGTRVPTVVIKLNSRIFQGLSKTADANFQRLNVDTHFYITYYVPCH